MATVPRGPYRTNVVTDEWSRQPELRLGVLRIPPNAETQHLHAALSIYGTVTHITIWNLSRGNFKEAKVTFAPPPSRAFWTSSFPIFINGATFHCRGYLMEQAAQVKHFVTSPCRRGVSYPVTMSFFADSMHFGFFKNPDAIMSMKVINPVEDKLKADKPLIDPNPSEFHIKMMLDLKEMRLQVYFPLILLDPRPNDDRYHKVMDPSMPIGHVDRVEYFRLSIPLAEVGTISQVKLDKDHEGLIIYLPTAPWVWKYDDLHRSLAENPSEWKYYDVWRRSTNAVYTNSIVDSNPLSLRNELIDINFGKWTTYLLKINVARESWLNTWHIFKDALEDYNIPVDTRDQFSILPREPCNFWKILDPPPDEVNHKYGDLYFLTPEHQEMVKQNHVQLPWEVRYQLESCISHGILNEYDMDWEFLEALADVANGNLRGLRKEVAETFEAMNEMDLDEVVEFFQPPPVEGKNPAALLLESIMDPKTLEERELKGKRIWDPMEIFSGRGSYLNADSGTGLAHYCTVTRKVVVTPTAILFKPPAVEISNRVNRHYSEYNQYFLRIQFSDERTRVSGKEGNSFDEIWARIFDVLQNGVTVGDRTFQYLACGSSQLREHGSHLFCPVNGITPDSIRAWMGDFSSIKVPAKYSARLGQCFSTTRAVKGITVTSLAEIPDIERNGYVFTDGVGKISDFASRMIAREWDLKKAPSAFQFRLGGCKGVLTVSPGMFNTEVLYRPSQKKFEAESKGLEVVRYSQVAPAFLNRQTIPILECLGVPAQVFLQLQDEQIRKFEQAMTMPDVAIEMLGKCIDQYQITSMISNMVKAGFLASQEPFLLSLLHLWKAWSLKMLKDKARILIEEGAFILGVADEFGVLRGHHDNLVRHLIEPSEAERAIEMENLPEIFLQIADPKDPTKKRIIEGLCVVGRNPSLHPGDLRVVVAVDKPELHHLVDVVVFPTTGDRPLPNMCSGGDLDGDDFFVFWDKRLIPTEWNYPAMNYTGPTPQTKDKVEMNHLIQFFVQYMKNDSLGRIAHAHLAQADYNAKEGGVKHKTCLELADLHSRAVDYVKTGAVAEMPKRLNPKHWPHFMERKNTYPSRTALGKLYDMVIQITRNVPENQANNRLKRRPLEQRVPFEFRPEYETPFDKRILNECPQNREILMTVRKIKTQYDAAMRRLMGQREIRTEFEVFTAFVMSKPRIGTDYELQMDVGREALALKQRFRAMVERAAGGNGFEKISPYVATMYRVTQEEVNIALHEATTERYFEESGRLRVKRNIDETSMPLTSFPWIFDYELCRIAIRASRRAEAAAQASADAAKDVSGEKEEDVPRTNGKAESSALQVNGVSTAGDVDTANDWGYTVDEEGRPMHHGEHLQIGGPRPGIQHPDAGYVPDIVEETLVAPIIDRLNANAATQAEGS